MFGEWLISIGIWSPCSLELLPTDFLWGAAKSKVSHNNPRSISELKTIQNYVQSITAQKHFRLPLNIGYIVCAVFCKILVIKLKPEHLVPLQRNSATYSHNLYTWCNQIISRLMVRWQYFCQHELSLLGIVIHTVESALPAYNKAVAGAIVD